MPWLRSDVNNNQVNSNDYLKSTDTVNRPASLLILLVIILVITAVIFSLFMSGRWLYNNITAKNNTTTSQPLKEDSAQSGSENNTPSGQNPSSNTNTNNQSGGNTATGTNSNGNQTNSSLPSSGPSPEPTTVIPNTGPEPE